MDALVVGVLGGGQLGRMMSQAASKLAIPFVSLDASDSPTAQLSQPHLAHPHLTDPLLAHAVGTFSDPLAIEAFARTVDVLTVEIEHVNADILQTIEQDSSQGRQGKGCKVYPSAQVIHTIQDKFRQKQHLSKEKLPTSKFIEIAESSDRDVLINAAQAAGEQIGYPFMLKSRLLAYDGRGNAKVESPEDISKAIESLFPASTDTDTDQRPPVAAKLYAEQFAQFSCEVAVMVVRSADGATRIYPPVETVHRENICRCVYAPLRKGGSNVASKAANLASSAVESLGEGAVGVFGVEMFLMYNDTLLINEIAPRPHNSYHHTIASTPISQFTAHLMAILSQPLPPQSSFELCVPSAAMLNILGSANGNKGVENVRKFVSFASQCRGTSIELYGKQGCRKGRKMGHVNIVGASDAQVAFTLDKLLKYQSGHPSSTSYYGEGSSDSNPLVAIVMGSDSDLSIMIKAAETLCTAPFDIPHEVSIVSAHRTPNLMVSFAQHAASRGIKVIIAGAGGSAHLPGMIASLTSIPVIGVPIKGSVLDGIDSLHSIVQMPKGIPVATVAINNSTNAALLAIRMLSCGQPELVKQMDEYRREMENDVLTKRYKLDRLGWEEYDLQYLWNPKPKN